MSTIAEASSLMADIAGPQRAGHKVKHVLAYLRTKFPEFTANRVADIFRGRPDIKVSADELKIIKAKKLEKDLADAKRKYQEALAIVRRGEAALLVSDPDFHSDYFDRLGDMAGDQDRALACPRGDDE